MKRSRSLHATLAFVATLLLVAAPGAIRTQNPQLPLQAQAESIVSSGDDWTIMAWSMDRKEALFAINAEEIKVPASNNKVFTSVWALATLGPDYRFPTDLLIPGGVPADGIVRGDVYLRGSGDPAFGFPEFTEDSTAPLRIMARQLRARGVRAVQGGVIADATVFDTIGFGPDWPEDTGNGVAFYAPRASGLPYQRNVVWIEAIPTRSGAPATIRTDPEVPGLPVVSTVRTGGGRAWAVRNPDEDTVRVKGAVSGRGPHRFPVGVTQPALLAAGGLRQALMEEGVQVAGGVGLGRVPDGSKLVHRHVSMPLHQMVPKLNRDSDNFFAEQLFLAATARSVDLGSYRLGGPASARFFIEHAGVQHGHLWQADGSGLSRQNRTSALAMVSALAYADVQPWAEHFHRSMAVGGERSGTLRRLFTSEPARGNLHAKTGYIRGVRSLSGYVDTRSGERVAFAFIYNGRNTSGARGIQEQLGELLASYAR